MKTPKIRTAPSKESKECHEDSVLEKNNFECPKAANIRKTPAKKSKFFSVSPRNKTTASSKEKVNGALEGTSKLSWFDIDSVYGFGPED